jgi:hypothetical protein
MENAWGGMECWWGCQGVGRERVLINANSRSAPNGVVVVNDDVAVLSLFPWTILGSCVLACGRCSKHVPAIPMLDDARWCGTSCWGCVRWVDTKRTA